MKAIAAIISIALAASATHADDVSGLIKDGAKPEKLAGGFKFTEGPAVDPDGNIFFTDIPNNRIHKWDIATKKLSTFLEDSGVPMAFISQGR